MLYVKYISTKKIHKYSITMTKKRKGKKSSEARCQFSPIRLAKIKESDNSASAGVRCILRL